MQAFSKFPQAPEIRKNAVAWLEDHKEWDVGNGAQLWMFVHDQAWDSYCKQMARSGETVITHVCNFI